MQVVEALGLAHFPLHEGGRPWRVIGLLGTSKLWWLWELTLFPPILSSCSLPTQSISTPPSGGQSRELTKSGQFWKFT